MKRNWFKKFDDVIGIYCITNVVSGKFYIGSSNNIGRRFREHFKNLKNNKHINPILQASYNKYGFDKFEYSVLEITTLDQLLTREQKYIDEKCPYFNVAKSAGRPNSICVSIHMYSLEGIFLKSFSSLREASKEIGCKESHICRMAKGKRKHVKGFVFSYQKYDNVIPTELAVPRKINQYGLDGTYIKTWDNIASACRGLGYYKAGISQSCRYKQICKKFQFRYHDGNTDNIASYPGLNQRGVKPVRQLTMEGDLIKTYPSVITAAKALGIPNNSISRTAKGRYKHSGGFKWEYA